MKTRDDYFDYYRDYHAFWKLYGIDLPDVVLKKVYYQNALRLTPAAPQNRLAEVTMVRICAHRTRRARASCSARAVGARMIPHSPSSRRAWSRRPSCDASHTPTRFTARSSPTSLRWMEDTSHQDVRAFVASQTAYTNAVLARLVNVEALQRTVDTAMAHTPTLDVVSPAAGRLFLTRWFGANPSLVVADSGSTAERVLLSADTLAARYDGAGLRAISPSADGRYVAVCATTNGDERAMILIIDATTGRILPDLIPDLLTTTAGTRYQVSWLPDGRGFFYPRLWPGSTTGPAVDRLARGRQFLHILGTPQSADVPVFGFDVARDVPMEEADLPTRVLATPGSRWLIASLTRVKEPGSSLYVASWDATSQRAALVAACGRLAREYQPITRAW